MEADVSSHPAESAGERDGDGRRLVARSVYHQPRTVTAAAGIVEVKAGD
ncbi:hypothetical protein [Streptomyces sp. NPDC059176]